MKASTEKVRSIVVIPFVVSAQKAVAISLTVRAAVPKDRQESAGAVTVKMRAFRSVALSAARIVGARVQPIAIALLVSVRAVSIVAIVR